MEGQLNAAGVFSATEVLAKHDENYMPPELMDLRGGATGHAKERHAGVSLGAKQADGHGSHS